MNTELKHTKDNGRVTGEVASHLTQNISADLKALQNDLVQLYRARERLRLLVDKLDLETAMSIVVELELTVLEDLEIVPNAISLLQNIVLLHFGELDSACDGSFLYYITASIERLHDQLFADILLLFINLLVTFDRLLLASNRHCSVLSDR